jgi:hypothetical protein
MLLLMPRESQKANRDVTRTALAKSDNVVSIEIHATHAHGIGNLSTMDDPRFPIDTRPPSN